MTTTNETKAAQETSSTNGQPDNVRWIPPGQLAAEWGMAARYIYPMIGTGEDCLRAVDFALLNSYTVKPPVGGCATQYTESSPPSQLFTLPPRSRITGPLPSAAHLSSAL